ncbi:MAG: metal ABC transporter ATP-binding protein [Akkermansia sp.]|nr:metal ABC transporter ATP-binding protein [Akkermansia sp.]
MVNEHHDHICWGGGHHHHTKHQLELQKVTAGYADEPVLQDISFTAGCGSTLALIGPNGAGKSTLLNALAGLLPVWSGSILWNNMALEEHRHEIAYLPQRSEVNWQFPITVRQLVEMGRYPAVGSWKAMRSHDREIVEKALCTLGLQELQHRQIGALSGGQQQRCFLARALAQEAHILLLDEPFTGLDVPGTEALSQILRSLAAEGRLVIASHHDLSSAPQIFDQALLLRKQVIACGPSQQVLTPDNLKQTFNPA